MFPRELYTSANIERERERKREKVPFLPTDVPRTRKNEKETKWNERGKEEMFPWKLYAPANREREKVLFSPNKKFLKERKWNEKEKKRNVIYFF